MIPVPCFIIYVQGKFILYDLKGELIDEKEETEDITNIPFIKIDSHFNEYLFYNNKNKLLKIFFFENQII